ncbi:glycoside hydrolase superfamily [Tribonema minus]|uniref:Glycoside hydrolase superfamily n=1 Tax=Tribonema minus TaxID=303371 RepID=A0A836CL70_9STRA|nr:glycoside hydrolase superfamily [Tribonema minus]
MASWVVGIDTDLDTAINAISPATTQTELIAAMLQLMDALATPAGASRLSKLAAADDAEYLAIDQKASQMRQALFELDYRHYVLAPAKPVRRTEATRHARTRQRSLKASESCEATGILEGGDGSGITSLIQGVNGDRIKCLAKGDCEDAQQDREACAGSECCAPPIPEIPFLEVCLSGELCVPIPTINTVTGKRDLCGLSPSSLNTLALLNVAMSHDKCISDIQAVLADKGLHRALASGVTVKVAASMCLNVEEFVKSAPGLSEDSAEPITKALEYLNIDTCIISANVVYHPLTGFLTFELNINGGVIALYVGVETQMYDDLKDKWGLCEGLADADCGDAKGAECCQMCAGENRGLVSMAVGLLFVGDQLTTLETLKEDGLRRRRTTAAAAVPASGGRAAAWTSHNYPHDTRRLSFWDDLVGVANTIKEEVIQPAADFVVDEEVSIKEGVEEGYHTVVYGVSSMLDRAEETLGKISIDWAQWRKFDRPDWRTEYAYTPSHLDPALYTHINYAFAKVERGTFAVVNMEPSDDELLRQLQVHRAAGIKVLISIGGWSFSRGEAVFVERTNFTLLLQELYTACQTACLLLTAATRSLIADQHYELGEIHKYLDFINLMTYDFNGGSFPGTQVANALAPVADCLSRWCGKPADIDTAVQQYLSAGVPASKLVLGLTTYACTFTLADPTGTLDPGIARTTGGPATAPTGGECTLTSATLSWYELKREMAAAGTMPVVHDASMSSYAVYGPNKQYWATFDSQETHRRKILGAFAASVSYTDSRAPAANDFIGLNYYNHYYVSLWNIMTEPVLEAKLKALPQEIMTDMPQCVYPEGLYSALKTMATLGKPIIVTENGIADKHDDRRYLYIRRYLYALSRAIQDGVDVIGYYYWSLYDSFEWCEGYHMKFGLYAVNFDTQERSLRPAAAAFTNVVLLLLAAAAATKHAMAGTATPREIRQSPQLSPKPQPPAPLGLLNKLSADFDKEKEENSKLKAALGNLSLARSPTIAKVMLPCVAAAEMHLNAEHLYAAVVEAQREWLDVMDEAKQSFYQFEVLVLKNVHVFMPGEAAAAAAKQP